MLPPPALLRWYPHSHEQPDGVVTFLYACLFLKCAAADVSEYITPGSWWMRFMCTYFLMDREQLRQKLRIENSCCNGPFGALFCREWGVTRRSFEA